MTDVANAVYDGTDAVMLSGETAQGKYPVEALQMMVHIIENTEQHLDYDMILDKAGDHLKRGISTAIGIFKSVINTGLVILTNWIANRKGYEGVM